MLAYLGDFTRNMVDLMEESWCVWVSTETNYDGRGESCLDGLSRMP
jgi:hypothetical protein